MAGLVASTAELNANGTVYTYRSSPRGFGAINRVGGYHVAFCTSAAMCGGGCADWQMFNEVEQMIQVTERTDRP